MYIKKFNEFLNEYNFGYGDDKNLNIDFLNEFMKQTGIKIIKQFGDESSECLVFLTSDNKVLKLYTIAKYKLNGNTIQNDWHLPVYEYLLDIKSPYLVKVFKTGLITVSDKYKALQSGDKFSMTYAYGNKDRKTYFVLQELLNPINDTISKIEKMLITKYKFRLWLIFNNPEYYEELININKVENNSVIKNLLNIKDELDRLNLGFTDYGDRQFGLDKNGVIKLFDISRINKDTNYTINNTYTI